MPFDMNTAKPIAAKPRFDLASAKPAIDVPTTAPSKAAVGAESILGNDRMAELSANPAAPLKGASPEPGANGLDRVQAGASGVNQGIAGLAGLPMDTMLNVWDLGKAAIGTLQGALTGGTPSEMFDPADRSGVPLSGQWNADRLNDLGIDTQAARPDDTASRYIHAAGTGVPGALVGGGGIPNTVRQVAAGAVAGVGAEGAADLGADEGQQAMIANALGIAAGHQAAKPTAPKPVVEKATVPEGKTKLAEMRQKGIKVTPKEATQLTGEKNYVGRALQAVGGDTKITKDMAAKNAPVLNEMARKAVGADSITETGLKPVKDAGNAVYEEMAGLGAVEPQDTLLKAIEGARGAATKSTKRNTDIDQFVDGVLNEFGGPVDASQIVNRVRELRRDSQNSRKGEGDKRPTVQQEALGEAQRKVADALDDMLEYHAATAGKPGLAEKYKQNRTRLAKVGTVEGASRAGNINAKELYDAKSKGAALSGNLGDIADAHEWAPGSTSPSGGESLMDAPGRNVDVLELPVMALQAAARHMGVNKLLQSDWYQNKIGGPKGGPIAPEYDPNPNAFPPQAPRAAEPAAPPSIDFAGELGLAPDPGPRDALPGGNSIRSIESDLQLAEDATVQGGPARRAGPQGDIDLDMEDPNGPFKFARGEQFNDARPVSGVQRGAAMDTGDLELAPDAPTGKPDEMPPKPRRLPVQGGAPRGPTPKQAQPAAEAAAQPPDGLSELGALIDEMLRTRNPRAQQMQNPAQQQQAQAQSVVPGTNFSKELGLTLEDGPAFNRADAPELGADTGGEPLDQRFGMPAPTRVTSGNGYISYIPGGDGVRQITGAFVKPSERGKGAGRANLLKLVDETAAAGEQLNSDASVSHDQLKVYQKLRDSGKIEFDTDEKAFNAALAGKTPMKGKTPVITNIRPVTKQ